MAMAAVLMGVGCGPQPDTQLGAPTTPDAVASSESGDEESASQESPEESAEETPDQATTASVTLPPVGPASPDAPPPFRWYQAVQTLDCGLMSDVSEPGQVPEEQRAMFAALAQLCGQLTGSGGTVDWDAARTAVEQASGESNCLVVAARELLGAAVALHDAHPDAQLTAGSPVEGTACPVGVTDIQAESLDSGYTLRVTGPYLFNVTAVSVDGIELSDVGSEDDLSGDPPQSVVSAAGSACLTAGQEVTITVVGDGYSVERSFTPDVQLGDCTAAQDQPSEDQPDDAAQDS